MEIEVITFHPSCGNNVNVCISKMLALYKKNNSRCSTESYTSSRFLTKLFCALDTCPVERFKAFVIQIKQRWIMEEIKDGYEIAKNLVKLSNNMGANSEWKLNTTKNQKFIALTTKIGQIEGRLKSPETRLKISSVGGGSRKVRKKGGKKTTLQNIKPGDL